MEQLLASVIPLSLGAAVSPTALAIIVLTLSGKVSPRARAWAEVIGMALALAVVTVLLLVLAQAIAGRKADPRVLGTFDLAAAVALLYLGVRDAMKLRSHDVGQKKQATSKAAGPKPNLPAFLLIGIALLVTDVTSLVLYLPAMKDIARSSVSLGEKLAVLAIPYFAVLAPAIIPAAIASVAPKSADRILDPLNAWVTKNQRVIGMVVCFAFGAYLLWKGYVGVTGP
jgi:threonine/homoserine/homoserine lactone efflux protein